MVEVHLLISTVNMVDHSEKVRFTTYTQQIFNVCTQENSMQIILLNNSKNNVFSGGKRGEELRDLHPKTLHKASRLSSVCSMSNTIMLFSSFSTRLIKINHESVFL